MFKSRGGVFLTGGIAQKIVPALKAGNFRAAFEDKAPHREMMASMPVYVITHPLAALVGSGRLCPRAGPLRRRNRGPSLARLTDTAERE